jgi:hypothetical protein
VGTAHHVPEVKSYLMRRIVFNTAAVFSLILCLFLIYSYFRSFLPGHLHFESVDGSLMVISWEGQIPSSPDSDTFNPSSEKFSGVRDILKYRTRQTERSFLGFKSFRNSGIFPGVNYHIFAIPYWIIILPTAILPILWLRHRRRRRFRAKAGHCLACGYDLRESKDKCPECGAAITATG